MIFFSQFRTSNIFFSTQKKIPHIKELYFKRLDKKKYYFYESKKILACFSQKK